MPKPYPKEFRDDVVAVARKGEAPIAQIAKDFGITESCLRNWLTAADVEDGAGPASPRPRRRAAGARNAGSGCWSRRTRSCAARRRICRRRTCRENDVPARP